MHPEKIPIVNQIMGLIYLFKNMNFVNHQTNKLYVNNGFIKGKGLRFHLSQFSSKSHPE
jgi:hypothetical protein